MNNEEKKQPEVAATAEETAPQTEETTVTETETEAAAKASFLKKLFSGKKARKSADMQRRLRHGRTARVLTFVVVAPAHAGSHRRLYAERHQH